MNGREGSVGIVAKLRAGHPRNYGFILGLGLEICLFSKASRLALGHTQSSMQWVWGVGLSWVLKRPGYEADHSSPYRANVKNDRS